MLGILNYEPNFFDDTEIFVKVLYDKLIGTIGLTLEDYWLMWDINENEWYNDGPVILKIGGAQFEFTTYNLDNFSLTFDKIDLTSKLDWYGIGDELPLIWKNRSNESVNNLLGRTILDIN